MPATEIVQMIDATGRLRYNPLRDFARHLSRTEFETHFGHPLLVSAALCEGDISEQSDKGTTMRFDLAQLQDRAQKRDDEPSDQEELQRSIYPFFKEPTSPAEPVSYTIGRIPGNDFMMVDYTISRQHAYIQVSAEPIYTITDCRSLNGTMLNDQPLSPEEPQPLVAGNKIRFGRFQFFFLSPTLLYVLLRQG